MPQLAVVVDVTRFTADEYVVVVIDDEPIEQFISSVAIECRVLRQKVLAVPDFMRLRNYSSALDIVRVITRDRKSRSLNSQGDVSLLNMDTDGFSFIRSSQL